MSKSPFSPGYNRMPLVFGGHERVVAEFDNVFENCDLGENQSVLLSGLRGAGKTSMMGVLADLATGHDWLVIRENASRGLMNRIMGTAIPKALSGLTRESRMRLIDLGIWNFSAGFEYVDRVREVEPLLRHDLVALAQSYRGILILIDEVSSTRVALQELSRLALEISHAIEEAINLVVVFAGVKIDLDELVDQPHMTFLRRSRRIDFQRLDPAATRKVLRETARIGGREFALDAEDCLIAASQGYPYLVQLAGDFAWREDPDADLITLADAEAASVKAIDAVEDRVIGSVYRDLSARDQDFLAAMAQDDGPSKMGDIVERMGVTKQYGQIYKQRLIDSGYVFAVGRRGYVDIALPYLREYVRARGRDEGEARRRESSGWEDFPPPPRPV